MFWVHGFEAIKKVSGDPADTDDGVKTGYKTTDSDESITEDEPIVNSNSENSEKNSNEHQQKKKLTNRTILANALETTAQNDIEKNKLAQYKEKIALIEKEEEKLAELRGKIKELSFAPGRRDTEAIRHIASWLLNFCYYASFNCI